MNQPTQLHKNKTKYKILTQSKKPKNQKTKKPKNQKKVFFLYIQ